MGMYLSRHAAAAAPGQRTEQDMECLIFLVGEDAYAIDFLAVREIRGYDGVLPVTGAPDCLKGVLNLRGTLVPVVDLRVRFGLGECRYDHVTDILVVETGNGIGGIVVDNVSEVARIEPGEMVPGPETGSRLPHSFLAGSARRDGRDVGFIDIARVFADIAVNPQACQVA